MPAEPRRTTAVPDAPDVPLRDLVPGFDRIADTPIPFGRLPARARTAFGDAYRTWGDLAGQTVTTLTARPKAGIVTAEALLAAARTAAAAPPVPDFGAGSPGHRAVCRLLDRLDAYDRALLSARGWALRPRTVPDTAALLGVSRTRVTADQPRARRRLIVLLADPDHADIGHAGTWVRHRLGPLTRERTARDLLTGLGLDPDGDTGALLLHVAGPYTVTGDWLHAGPGADGLAAAATVVDAATASWAPTTAALVHRLAALGIPARTAEDFLRTRPGLRAFGDRWVRWGPTFAEKTVAALHLVGRPATVAQLAAAVGQPEAPVRDALRHDRRFVRATRATWALRDWNPDVYTGLFDAIAARLDAHTGPVPVATLVADIRATLPDVAEPSIRATLYAPGFVVDGGAVRRRTRADGPPTVHALNTVRGVFRVGAHGIRVALPVSRELLRGSGQNISPALATALGVHPGERREFTGPTVGLTLTWRESALNGATLGSLRGLAEELRAGLGDAIVLAFDTVEGTVAAYPLPADADDRDRLRILLGTDSDPTPADLARALDCAPNRVAHVLTARGDRHLLPRGD